MLYGERNKQKLQKARGLAIGISQFKHELEIPKYRLNKVPMQAGTAKSLIESLLLDEGNSRQNMATFCQTHMEKEATELMAETLDKNAIDKSEYPQTAELENRCVNILADLWNVRKKSGYLGTSTVGSSETCMLAGMAINFSRSASQIVGQYYNFLRLGWEGYRITHLKTLGNASAIGDAVAESGLFDVYNSGKRTPIVCYTLKKDAKYSDGTPVVWNLYDLADRLQMHGWQVPAYPLPEGAEDVTVQRIVCRADLTYALTEAFVDDFQKCLSDLKEAHVLCNEKKSGNYGFTY